MKKIRELISNIKNKKKNRNADKKLEASMFAETTGKEICEHGKDLNHDICYKAFCFSFTTFFSGGIKEEIGGLPEERNYKNLIEDKQIETKLGEFSKIFQDIVTIRKYDKSLKNEHIEEKSLTIFKKGSSIGIFINEIIKNHYSNQERNKNTKLLQIEGPIGCYKNRLLQYIYLMQLAKLEVPIFYIDLSKYETDNNDIKEHIKTIQEILSDYQGSPLFILDNLRGFSCGKQQGIYMSYKEYLDTINCSLILSRDVQFSRFKTRDYISPFGSYKDFSNSLNITSMNLNREIESEIYIKNFMNFFGNSFDELKRIRCMDSPNNEGSFWANGEWQYSNIRRYLLDMELFTIDAYQLKEILTIIKGTAQGDGSLSLLSIYENYISNLGITSSEIPKEAFKFEYTSDATADEAVNFEDNDWEKIRKHRSILDYMTSRYFIEILNQELNKSEKAREHYSLPNVLFPKSVTRFIVPAFIDNNNIQSYIVCCFRNCESKIEENFGRLAQLAFLLGRINDNGAKEVLKECLSIVESCTKENAKAFLKRSLYISLIYQGDKSSFLDYCNLLLSGENIHKRINIGFHLDYYGDKTVAFIINKTPDYSTDDVQRCLNTLRKLAIDLRKRLNIPETSLQEKDKLIVILQLITYCQIIEKRNYDLEDISSEKEKFIDFVKEFLIIVLRDKRKIYESCLDEKIEDYLTLQYLRTLSDERSIRKTKLYNKFSCLQNIGRIGWINRGLNEGYDDKGEKNGKIAESIAEHIYNCWLMGYIYLPTHIDNVKYYSKKKISNLLLIHDCGEAEIGDIVTSEKKDDDRAKEKETLQRITNKQFAALWSRMDKIDNINIDNNINANIAHDIDKIQAAYQFFSYVVDGKLCKDNIEVWLSEICDYEIVTDTEKQGKGIITEIGKSLREIVIFANEKFFKDSELVKEFFKCQTNLLKN